MIQVDLAVPTAFGVAAAPMLLSCEGPPRRVLVVLADRGMLTWIDAWGRRDDGRVDKLVREAVPDLVDEAISGMREGLNDYDRERVVELACLLLTTSAPLTSPN